MFGLLMFDSYMTLAFLVGRHTTLETVDACRWQIERVKRANYYEVFLSKSAGLKEQIESIKPYTPIPYEQQDK